MANGSPSSTSASRGARLGAVALAAALLGVGSMDSADADTGERSRYEVLELKVDNDQYKAVDLGPEGPSLGDMDVYSGTAVEDGRRIGHGGGSCQVVRIEDGKRTTQCVITMELERGSLTMQSLWTSGSSTLDMAITGGTGYYDNARGTARYWDIATPQERMRAEILR
ncbi:hypothetical protein ABZ923_00240 [Streptomyces sp. NPDC046881]|uniref:allene oxide cyclase barrel-like domain-containing protein n=1 Tax=Streptomyces sp. NPDC046881 TaxID=3155374 RepID=UPI0033FD9632